MLDALPRPLQILAVVVICLVIFGCVIVLVLPKRDTRPDDQVGPRTSAMRAQARGAHRGGATSLDKRRELDQADTGPVPAAPRKLPGQDRLTRISRTGMDAQDRDWTEPPDAIPAAADDHPSGGTPALAQQEPPRLRPDDDGHPSTSAMPAVLPPLPPIRPRTGPAAASGPHQPSAPALPHETRAERRRRMEALALERATQDREDDRPPESP